MLATIANTANPPRVPASQSDEARWPASGRPLDAWVRGELSKRFDPVLVEDVPEDLLAILKMVH